MPYSIWPSKLSRLAPRLDGVSGMMMPYLWARYSAAAVKSRFSSSMMNLKTSPPLPQPKHLKIWRSGFTVNDGVFS